MSRYEASDDVLNILIWRSTSLERRAYGETTYLPIISAVFFTTLDPLFNFEPIKTVVNYLSAKYFDRLVASVMHKDALEELDEKP